MAITFPTALDAFGSTTPSTPLGTAVAGRAHSQAHTDLGAAILALETKVGITGSADTGSLDYKVANRQPLDANLTAIAALTTTAFGRDFLTRADAAAGLAYIGAAADAAVVHLAGTETITGAKTFSAQLKATGGLQAGGTLASLAASSLHSDLAGGYTRLLATGPDNATRGKYAIECCAADGSLYQSIGYLDGTTQGISWNYATVIGGAAVGTPLAGEVAAGGGILHAGTTLRVGLGSAASGLEIDSNTLPYVQFKEGGTSRAYLTANGDDTLEVRDSTAATVLAAISAAGVFSPAYHVGANQVVGARGAAVADATGGATVDAEARTAINTLLARLRTHGLIAP